MKAFPIALCLLFLLVAPALAQLNPADTVDVAPGIKMEPNGIIDVSDMTAEIYYFDNTWSLSEQHDTFQAGAPATLKTPNSHGVSGVFQRDPGPFNLTEQIVAGDGGAADFSASVTSDKDLPTNELSLSFALPVSSFGGKSIMIDGQPFILPADPAKQGQPHLLDKSGVHQVELTTANGTLTLTGNLSFLVQDDREFGDDRYDLRLHFNPNAGTYKQSKLEFQMKWKGK